MHVCGILGRSSSKAKIILKKNYLVDVQKVIPGFGENQKTGREILKTGNGFGSAYFKNDSTFFIQIRCINAPF